jgi:hypothetical protein
VNGAGGPRLKRVRMLRDLAALVVIQRSSARLFFAQFIA